MRLDMGPQARPSSAYDLDNAVDVEIQDVCVDDQCRCVEFVQRMTYLGDKVVLQHSILLFVEFSSEEWSVREGTVMRLVMSSRAGSYIAQRCA